MGLNAKKHGRHTARSREIQAHGRLLNRVADLARAQMAVMNARARGDDRRVEIAEQRTIVCKQRLRQAALALDCVLVERGDADGRRLVEGALRLVATV